MKKFRSVSDVLSTTWGAIRPAKPDQSDRVMKSTRLEAAIYTDLRGGDQDMDTLETAATEKLRSFPALSRDVYQSFYALNPRRKEENELTATARKFNAHILDYVVKNEDYPTIKSICEGRELPAYEAATEFVQQVSGELDSLMENAEGKKGSLGTLEKLEAAQDSAHKELSRLLDRLQSTAAKNATLEQSVVDAANKAESKQRQVDAVSKMVDTNLAQNKAAIGEVIATAVEAACRKAEETQNIIGAWGDEPGSMERSPMNMALLARVRESQTLLDVSKYLGRFREMFAQGKKNGYAYGRGEKYALELGRDLSRAITPELSMLALPETVPLFLRKYQRGQLKQYRRREPVRKGMGNIIACIDESDSARGDARAWAKAVAMTLLEIAADGHRKYALVHFSGKGSYMTDVFLPGRTMPSGASGGGAVYGRRHGFCNAAPGVAAAHRSRRLENADIVFITDGECALPEAFIKELREEQIARKFTVTGILLDKGGAGMDFSLKGFCEKIYRTSELLGEDIVGDLISGRI
jgi:uncharacterized protein with von Willebrand factor type A (vWA) domain